MIPLVVHVVDLEGGTAEQFAFLRSPVRIGRSELNDLPLPKLFVSIYHGLVRFDDEGARYVDLGSTNGSVLDGVGLPANAPTFLAAGAELVIGTYKVTFERVTGEQVVVPRQTMFDVRVATMADSRGRPGELEHSGIAASSASEAGVQEPGSAEGFGVRESAPALEGVAPGTSAHDAGLSEASLRLLRAFAESYLPGESMLTTPQDVESVLGRVACALETFARSFLELRRGYDEFGRQMGVRTVQAEGPLLRAHDPDQVLTYMLDPAAQGRDAELRRAFAEFMIHQVALVRGVVDGARALLARLSPDAILLSATWSAWPVRAAKLWKWIPLWKPLWKEFERRFHDLADEENSISKVLFGKEFARAYTSMAGQAPGDDEADADVTLRSAR
jgi:predicted component of type VI protein secretion system